MQSLDELETVIDALTARLATLADENAVLRAKLSEQSERMRTAGHKLRVVAERLPEPASADKPEAKAA
jgi:hypothetical protein